MHPRSHQIRSVPQIARVDVLLYSVLVMMTGTSSVFCGRYGSRSTASSTERVKPEWVKTTMTFSGAYANRLYRKLVARLVCSFCVSLSLVHRRSGSLMRPKPPFAAVRSPREPTKGNSNWGNLERRPFSNEQGPLTGTRGSGSLTDLRASHVSSPSVSRTYSSTLHALMGSPLPTSCAVCRQRDSGDTMARAVRLPLMRANQPPPLRMVLR
mmetsp:Transcript_26247/g.66818  ORF Transcript_26247/g.66818 Transcript_26247/m.66818 type:complete len:211 (-) Transcript_26247:548-1180(-)